MILSSDRYFQTRSCTIMIQNLIQKIFHHSPPARAETRFESIWYRNSSENICLTLRSHGNYTLPKSKDQFLILLIILSLILMTMKEQISTALPGKFFQTWRTHSNFTLPKNKDHFLIRLIFLSLVLMTMKGQRCTALPGKQF